MVNFDDEVFKGEVWDPETDTVSICGDSADQPLAVSSRLPRKVRTDSKKGKRLETSVYPPFRFPFAPY
jgi:hypothetical protein